MEPFQSMTVKELSDQIGGLSNPGKMPGHGWGISADLCNVGTSLQNVKGSICFDCYAMKGRYRMPNVVEAHKRRIDLYRLGPWRWSKAMAELINRKKLTLFRWFDSGDLQDVTMLAYIVSIACDCPNTTFWLPTREARILDQYVTAWGNQWPVNLTIRLSSISVDDLPRASIADRLNVMTSTVTTSKDKATCPATTSSDKTCKAHGCTACWQKGFNISYLKH